MLGYVETDATGYRAGLLAALVARLQAEGRPVAGALQSAAPTQAVGRPDMLLRLIACGTELVISQRLGPGAKGCRLDPDRMERAAGRVMAALDAAPAFLIVNKFGKVEAEGRGFRTVIGEAAIRGIPVLTTVAAAHRAAFLAFAGPLATALPADPAALHAWCATPRAAIG